MIERIVSVKPAAFFGAGHYWVTYFGTRPDIYERTASEGTVLVKANSPIAAVEVLHMQYEKLKVYNQWKQDKVLQEVGLYEEYIKLTCDPNRRSNPTKEELQTLHDEVWRRLEAAKRN